ncbi:carotenoid biosynthesis protein [candidate division KSB1 bacterium]|nr:carotenoid biosynthesis protein [candidate division KSB1 bacterium]
MEKPHHSISQILKNDTVHIGLLYFLLFAGGLWHALGVFQNMMRYLASPMMIGLAIILLMKVYPVFRDLRGRYFMWSTGVFVSGFAVELIGVSTGHIFGIYSYGFILQPQLFNVPIAIGCAWFTMLISSAAVIQRFVPFSHRLPSWIFAIAVACMMVFFDSIMEHAAVRLHYWQWEQGMPTMQNYAAWFVIGFFLIFIGRQLRLFRTAVPMFSFHVFFAQIIYFIMTLA